MLIIRISICVKIKHVAESDKQLKKIDKGLQIRTLKDLKKLLTDSEASDILSKLLEGDKKQHKITTKVVKENGL